MTNGSRSVRKNRTDFLQLVSQSHCT